MTTPAVLEPGLLSAATPVIIGHEGERMRVYRDDLGVPTVGVGLALMYKNPRGFLMNSAYAKGLCERCGVDYFAVLRGRAELTYDQSRQLLDLCIIDVIEWLVTIFPAFWTYSQPRQIALVDMGFNLGETKFRGFHEMIQCILAGDWAGAAAQALHSKWATEVPTRAEYDTGLLRGDQ